MLLAARCLLLAARCLPLAARCLQLPCWLLPAEAALLLLLLTPDPLSRLSASLEIVECLKAQLPVDAAALDAAAADPENWMWQAWDLDGSGYVERNELLHPQGLVAYVRSAFERAAVQNEAIPDIMSDKNAW